jgi:hypothetical protein
VAQPLVNEMRAILLSMGSGPTLHVENKALRLSGSTPKKVTHWVNLRIEPLIYINGKPFVLRSIEDPKSTLQDYIGIDVARLEAMESRLIEDILEEARQVVHDEKRNKVLVHVEVNDEEPSVPTKPEYAVPKEKIITNWEPIVNAESVRTPRQICDSLVAEGYKVHYTRLPVVISPTAHSPKDYFDEFLTTIRNSGKIVYTYRSLYYRYSAKLLY